MVALLLLRVSLHGGKEARVAVRCVLLIDHHTTSPRNVTCRPKCDVLFVDFLGSPCKTSEARQDLELPLRSSPLPGFCVYNSHPLITTNRYRRWSEG